MGNLVDEVELLPKTTDEALVNIKNYIEDLKNDSDSYYDEDYISLTETDEDYFFNCEDGSGNELKVVLIKTGGYIIFAYDHEDQNNFYTEPDEETLQMNLYKGIPEEFSKYVYDERLFWSFEENQKYVYSSATVWVTVDGQIGYNDTAYEDTDGGFGWLTRPLLVNNGLN